MSICSNFFISFLLFFFFIFFVFTIFTILFLFVFRFFLYSHVTHVRSSMLLHKCFFQHFSCTYDLNIRFHSDPQAIRRGSAREPLTILSSKKRVTANGNEFGPVQAQVQLLAGIEVNRAANPIVIHFRCAVPGRHVRVAGGAWRDDATSLSSRSRRRCKRRCGCPLGVEEPAGRGGVVDAERENIKSERDDHRSSDGAINPLAGRIIAPPPLYTPAPWPRPRAPDNSGPQL